MPCQCPVCGDKMLFSSQDTRPLCTIPCGHVYHEACLAPLFAGIRQSTLGITTKPCPMCRKVFQKPEISRLFVNYEPLKDERDISNEQQQACVDLEALQAKFKSNAASQKRALQKAARSTAELEKSIATIAGKLKRGDERLDEASDQLIAARAEYRSKVIKITGDHESIAKEKDEKIKQIEQTKGALATKNEDLIRQLQRKTNENALLQQCLDSAQAGLHRATAEAATSKSKLSSITTEKDAKIKELENRTAALKSENEILTLKTKQYSKLSDLYWNEKNALQLKLDNATDGQSQLRKSLARIRALTNGEPPAKRPRED